MKPTPWKTLSSREVYENPWMRGDRRASRFRPALGMRLVLQKGPRVRGQGGVPL